MVILNRHQELPRDRPELYNQASRVLLHQWDVERNLIEHRLDPMTINYQDKQAMLRKVAYHMQLSEKGLAGNIISSTNLEDIMAEYLKTREIEQPKTIARLMIKQLRERNFILCYLGSDSYAFIHRTFLEYFCAWEFVWQFKETQVLTLDQIKDEVFIQHCQHEPWHEVLRLISGMLNEKFAIEAIDSLISECNSRKSRKTTILAAECFLEMKNYNSSATAKNKLFSNLQDIIRSEVIDHLNFSQKQSNFQEDELHAYPTYYSSGEEFGITSESALNLILKVWGNDTIVLQLLKDCAKPRNFWTVQDMALKELAQHWKDDPDTLATLKHWIEFCTHGEIIKTTLRELTSGWKNDPNTLSTLRKYIFSGSEPLGRIQAIEELAENWRHEPWLFELLYDRAFHDPFERKKTPPWIINPRQAAIEAIIKNYFNNPKTIDLLIDRAQNDPDEKVREFAQQKLEELGKK